MLFFSWLLSDSDEYEWKPVCLGGYEGCKWQAVMSDEWREKQRGADVFVSFSLTKQNKKLFTLVFLSFMPVETSGGRELADIIETISHVKMLNEGLQEDLG